MWSRVPVTHLQAHSADGPQSTCQRKFTSFPRVGWDTAQRLSSGAPAGPTIACPDTQHAALSPGSPGSWPSQASWVHQGAGLGLKSGVMRTHCTVSGLPRSSRGWVPMSPAYGIRKRLWRLAGGSGQPSFWRAGDPIKTLIFKYHSQAAPASLPCSLSSRTGHLTQAAKGAVMNICSARCWVSTLRGLLPGEATSAPPRFPGASQTHRGLQAETPSPLPDTTITITPASSSSCSQGTAMAPSRPFPRPSHSPS